jgi:hypothetical protein
MEMKGKQQQTNLLICNIYDEEWKSVIRKNIKATEKIYQNNNAKKMRKKRTCKRSNNNLE